MWEAIKQLCPHDHPTHMQLLRKAAANAFSIFWPHTHIKGCSFHLTQNIFRKIQAGLQNEYQQNENFAIQIKQLHALVFVYTYDTV